MDAFDGVLREAMLVTGLICLPVVIVAALVGVGVALVQAATQVQEQTLTLLPKILAVAAALVVFGAFGMHLLEQLFRDVVAAIPSLVYGS
jgi:flagellar biosynthetic protein FliQ